jgi:uncharacterized membrane protein YfcA
MPYFWLILAAITAGLMNSVAGGGTLLTFPALMFVGVDSVRANGMSTISLLPGSVAGAVGFRQELRATKRWLVLLIPPCFVGALTGTLLVTELDKKYFEALVPWLILTAATLFLLQPSIARWAKVGQEHAPPNRLTIVGIVIFQFFVALYGGYFGAGIGILMISSLSLLGLGDIHRVNALKTVLAACINIVSAITWVLKTKIEWMFVLPMVAAAILGGYLGARFSRRLDKRVVRWIVIVIGFGLAGWYLWKRYGP